MIKGEHKPSVATVKLRLEQHYGQDVTFYERCGIGSIVWFKSVGAKLLRDSRRGCSNDNSNNNEEDIIKIMRHAGRNLRRHIRSQEFDTTSYPPSDNFLNDVESVIPEALHAFLDGFILKEKKGP